LEIVKRQVHFIAAAKSMRRPFVGSLIKATGAIPVERPQDLGKENGPGVITDLVGGILKGDKTKFSKLTAGTSLFLEGLP